MYSKRLLSLALVYVGMSLFSSFFVLLLVLIEASPTSASVSCLGKHVRCILSLDCV